MSFLEYGSSCGNSGQGVHFKDRRGGEDLSIVRVQLWISRWLWPLDDLLQQQTSLLETFTAISLIFVCCDFIFFCFKIIFNCSFIFSLIHWLFQSVLFHFHWFTKFPAYFLLCISHFIHITVVWNTETSLCWQRSV